MQKRYLYALMFAVPGFLVALLTALWLFEVVAGGLWLFVFGDDTWSVTSVQLLPILFGVMLLTIWALAVTRAYLFGKRQEAEPGFNRRHLFMAVGLTIMPLALLLLHQWGVGNLGPKSNSEVCSDYCLEQGYAGSGMPPRDSGDNSCICYDTTGRAVVVVPIDRLTGFSKE